MGLFSGLEAFGFKNEDLKVYSDTKEKEKAEQQAQKQDVRVNEEDCLFPKTHKCPVCDKEFKSLAVRAGKLRSVGQDDDLRPLYKDIDLSLIHI